MKCECHVFWSGWRDCKENVDPQLEKRHYFEKKLVPQISNLMVLAAVLIQKSKDKIRIKIIEDRKISL